MFSVYPGIAYCSGVVFLGVFDADVPNHTAKHKVDIKAILNCDL